MGVLQKNLWVKNGTILLNGKTVPFWGFASQNSNPQLPGPVIEAKVGDKIKITLFNSLLNSNSIGEPISLIFPGQKNVKVKEWLYGDYHLVQPQYENGKLVSLTDYLETTSYYYPTALKYKFRAKRPGIFLYESGTNSEKQIQMGAYGAVIIKPKGYDDPSHVNYKTAYGHDTKSNYDIEKILVLGEIDSNMHDKIIPGEYYDMLEFKPDYWLIDGRCYPDTINNNYTSTQPYNSKINCKVGDRVLLRIVNAGFETHTVNLGGLTGRVIAEDSYPLVRSGVDTTYEKTGITLASGKSIDIIVTPSTQGEFYLYARELNHIVNNDEFPGGMMTKIEVSL